MRTRVIIAVTVAAWTTILATFACSHRATDPPGAGVQATMVVGITSDDMGGALGAVHVTATVDGTPAADETIAGAPSAYPAEIHLMAPDASPSAHISVEIDGYADPRWAPGANAQPLLSRLAEASFVPATSMLMHVHLERPCLLGPAGGPSCNPSPETCIAGACRSDALGLESYRPGWSADPPDACKPLNAAPPEVFVGQGQSDYAPVVDGQTVQLELGPQGGHHLWLAARMHDLRQSGSTTLVTGVQPGTSIAAPSTGFVFDYQEDQGGFCKVAGLRYQIDSDGSDYHQFLGKPLDVTVEVIDAAGTHAEATVHLAIAPTLSCPVPGPGCP